MREIPRWMAAVITVLVLGTVGSIFKLQADYGAVRTDVAAERSARVQQSQSYANVANDLQTSIDQTRALVKQVENSGDQPVISENNIPDPAPAKIPGPKGDAGTQGLQGDQGVQGVQGVQGPAGLQGETGAKGADGADGAQGAKGDKGDQGEQGPKGEQGDKGEQGKDGLDGKDGAAGKPGTGITSVACAGVLPDTTFTFTFSDGTSQEVSCS